MDLVTATEGMLSAQEALRQPAAIANPSLISDQMYKLAQYTAAVEYHLAIEEREYEKDEAIIYRRAIRQDKLSASAAEKEVKMELGEREGQIKYLKRVCDTAWKLHMNCMAKIKHLEGENRGSI